MAELQTTPSIKHRLLSGGLWALSGKVLTAFTGLATYALLARLLSPQDLGVYFLALSIVLLGTAVGSLGLQQTVLRFVAESIGRNQPGRVRRAVSTIYILGILGALAAGLAYLLFGDILVEKLFASPALVGITGLVASFMVVMTLQGLLAETFRGFHDIRLATLFGGLVTSMLLSVFLALLWLLKGHSNLGTVMLLAVGSTLASAAVAAWLLRSRISSLARDSAYVGMREFKEIVDVSWPLWVTNVIIFALAQVDLWIVGAFRSQEDVALYGAAVKLVLYVVIPLQLINFVVAPLIAELYAQGRKRELESTLRSTATLAGVPAFIIVVSFVLLGRPILGLIFGGYYRDAALILVLLSVGYLAAVWAGSCGVTLIMTGHQMVLMGISIMSGLFVIAGAMWAVQEHGAVGVASVAAAGQVFHNIAMLIGAKATTGMWTHAKFGSISKVLSVVRARF
jgi:O-antigen/teichoic acid export membrane protein